MKRSLPFLFASLLVAMVQAQAADPAAPAQPQAEPAAPKKIFGRDLMTMEERREYRLKMMEAKNDEERLKLRLEHHKQMQQRAQERGMILADPIPTSGSRSVPPRGGAGMGRPPLVTPSPTPAPSPSPTPVPAATTAPAPAPNPAPMPNPNQP